MHARYAIEKPTPAGRAPSAEETLREEMRAELAAACAISGCKYSGTIRTRAFILDRKHAEATHNFAHDDAHIRMSDHAGSYWQ
jgi:hypothetical protein